MQDAGDEVGRVVEEFQVRLDEIEVRGGGGDGAP